jgi:A/G-specific adenine glycosylase
LRDLSEELLAWYDVHARVMPWRVDPGESKAGKRPDPYFIWMSEVMLQQTTVAAVKEYFRKFTTIWPTVRDLAAADDADVMAAWAGLGYYARARNLLKCARVVVNEHDGRFPDTYDQLLTLPGVGPYTAAAVASIAFNQRATVLDGNVERVMSRMYDVHDPLPGSKPALMTLAEALTPHDRPGDYAQAVMDLGATICTPKKPACGICPWRDPCTARVAGTAVELPKKTPKKKTPIRLGYVYVVRREDGAWLLETRPDKGLLGGMLAFPSSDWSDDPTPNPPMDAAWEDSGQEARHTFTHFHLRLKIMTATVSDAQTPERGAFVSHVDFAPAALPTAMRKVVDLIPATQRHD